MQRQFCEFGDFRLDPRQRVLLRRGALVHLTGKEFDTLWALARQAGTPVEKEALLKEVWGETTVGEENLRQHVRALRKKLGKDPQGEDYIRTIPNRGYFLATVVLSREEPDPPPHSPPPAAAASPIDAVPRRRKRRILAIACGALAILVVIWSADRSVSPDPNPYPVTGRLLARSTSQGRSPRRIALSHQLVHLAISPDGRKLFATGDAEQTLSVVSTADDSVRVFHLPRAAGPIAASRSGQLFIGSSADGLMVLDIRTEQLLPIVIPTGAGVLDIAVTPDGKKIFLALGMAGVMRVTAGSWKTSRITDRVCPQYLEIDSQGKNLYVSYQCGGPTGRAGHDAVEAYDVAREARIWTVSGPPMVGGHPLASPDGNLLLLDGLDACDNPAYDHVGCPTQPGRVVHLLRPSDRQLLRTLTFPGPSRRRPLAFVDNARFVLGGDTLSVFDARRYTLLESLDAGPSYQSLVFAPGLRRIYAGNLPTKSLLVLDLEGPECSQSPSGLSILYSADGVFEDVAGLASLEPRGTVTFQPGKVGQAFRLEGGSFLEAPWTGAYEFGRQDATLALYVQFAGLRGEQVLVSRRSKSHAAGMTLLKSNDNRLVFLTAMPGEDRTNCKALQPSGPACGTTWPSPRTNNRRCCM